MPGRGVIRVLAAQLGGVLSSLFTCDTQTASGVWGALGAAALEGRLLARLVERGLDALLDQVCVYARRVCVPLLGALVFDRLALEELLAVPLVETAVVLLLQLGAFGCKARRHHVAHALLLAVLGVVGSWRGGRRAGAFIPRPALGAG